MIKVPSRTQALPQIILNEEEEAATPSATKRLLVPCKLSESTEAVLRMAVSMARDLQGKLFLMSVVEPEPLAERGYVPRLVEDLQEASHRQLHELASRLVPDHLLEDIVVRHGEPWREITLEAIRQNADLILAITHGHVDANYDELNRTTEKVAQHAPCPVLTVKIPKDEAVETGHVEQAKAA